MNKTQVVGVGALNIDRIYTVAAILDDSETVVEKTESFPGGSAANTIYGLGRLGIAAGFCGAAGDDDEGRILLDDFKKAGIDTSRIKVKTKAGTGQVIDLSAKGGQRSLYVLPGANNLLNLEDIDLSYINRADILHLSSFADEKQFKLSLELLEKLDRRVKLSFAPGIIYTAKGLKALTPFLHRSHILFINRDEIEQLTKADIVEGAARCLETGCRIVAVTLGKGAWLKNTSASAYIRDAEKEYLIEPKGTRAITDTTGAGDAFACGFLYGVINNKDPEECGRLGDIVAQFSISQTGARQGLPTANQLASRYLELHQKEL
jgi:ribokinase